MTVLVAAFLGEPRNVAPYCDRLYQFYTSTSIFDEDPAFEVAEEAITALNVSPPSFRSDWRSLKELFTPNPNEPPLVHRARVIKGSAPPASPFRRISADFHERCPLKYPLPGVDGVRLGLPSVPGRLDAQLYQATVRGIPINIDLRDMAWSLDSPRGIDYLALSSSAENRVRLLAPSQVFDLGAESQSTWPGSRNLEVWLRANPAIKTTYSRPIRMGTSRGSIVEVAATSMTQHGTCIYLIRVPCVPLFVTPGGVLEIRGDYRYLFCTCSPGGRQLVVAIEAPLLQFDSFAPAALRALFITELEN